MEEKKNKSTAQCSNFWLTFALWLHFLMPVQQGHYFEEVTSPLLCPSPPQKTSSWKSLIPGVQRKLFVPLLAEKRNCRVNRSPQETLWRRFLVLEIGHLFQWLSWTCSKSEEVWRRWRLWHGGTEAPMLGRAIKAFLNITECRTCSNSSFEREIFWKGCLPGGQ